MRHTGFPVDQKANESRCQIVVSTQQLSRHFGATVAVDQLTLEIERGEVFGFLGHNGAGKTTTVRLLNGVLTPTAGSMRVFGLDPTVDGAQVRARTGVLTETPALDDRMTAYATLCFLRRDVRCASNPGEGAGG